MSAHAAGPAPALDTPPGLAPVTALRRAYPVALPDDGKAQAWVSARGAVLRARVDGDGDASLAVSSGCAATGATRHRRALHEQAGEALVRLRDGSLVDCARCGRRLDFERLDALVGVVDCADCRRTEAGAPDTRWCR